MPLIIRSARVSMNYSPVTYSQTWIFLFGQSKKRFSAHRVVLAASSDVFRAMFCSGLASNGPPDSSSKIDIPDVDPAAFELLLRYVYVDHCEDLFNWATVDSDLILLTLYAAKKYLVHGLAERCSHYLMMEVCIDNVLSILAHALLFNEHHMSELCLRLVDAEPERVFASSGWLRAPRSVIQEVVARPGLTCREADVFRALLRWGCVQSCAQRAAQRHQNC